MKLARATLPLLALALPTVLPAAPAQAMLVCRAEPSPDLPRTPLLNVVAACPERERPAGFDALSWPTTGPITTYFGEVGPTSPRGHAGLDIAAPTGAPVRAALAGTVTTAGWAPDGYGNRVVLEHSRDLTTLYAHLSEIDVEPGTTVLPSQPIGLVGSTGYSTGPHLHFEVRRSDALLDPSSYLP